MDNPSGGAPALGGAVSCSGCCWEWDIVGIMRREPASGPDLTPRRGAPPRPLHAAPSPAGRPRLTLPPETSRFQFLPVIRNLERPAG